MAVEIPGFAETLARCQAFHGVDADELENSLAIAEAPLQMKFVDPSTEVPLIRSGDRFEHLFFVQHGTIATWQYPRSELSSPFLIGDHEFTMGAERWVASYSALTRATIVGIPISTMKLILDRMPQIQPRMSLIVLRRMARYYWISLATNGSPASRVAAALVSRLAIDGMDYGSERDVSVRQRDIVRLTVMSRSAVASGISLLLAENLISLGVQGRERFSGMVHIPEVDRLKDRALDEVRNRLIRPLIRLD